MDLTGSEIFAVSLTLQKLKDVWAKAEFLPNIRMEIRNGSKASIHDLNRRFGEVKKPQSFTIKALLTTTLVSDQF